MLPLLKKSSFTLIRMRIILYILFVTQLHSNQKSAPNCRGTCFWTEQVVESGWNQWVSLSETPYLVEQTQSVCAICNTYSENQGNQNSVKYLKY